MGKAKGVIVKKGKSKSCGGKSSKKPTLGKPKKKVDAVKYVKEKLMVTVVCGLKEFLKEGQKEYHRLIKRDVELVSRLMYVYSIYLHFVFNKIISTRSYKGEHNMSDQRLAQLFKGFREGYEYRRWLFALQGKAGFDLDPKFKRWFEGNGLLVADYEYTASLLQQEVKQYHTCFSTNLTTHMSKRLYKFLTKVSGDISGRSAVLSKEDARSTLKKVLGPRVGLKANEKAFILALEMKTFGISFNSWHLQANAFQYIPLLTKIQHMLFEKGHKSFVVIPQCRAGLRKVLYTNTAFKELVTHRLKELNEPRSNLEDFSADYRKYWAEVFDIERHETANKKFKEIRTDGVTCCVIMEKPNVVRQGAVRSREVVLSNGESLLLPNEVEMYGFDPGLIAMLGGVKIDLSQKVAEEENFHNELLSVKPIAETGCESNILMDAAAFRHHSGYNDRKAVLRKVTGYLEKNISDEREASAAGGIVISQRSPKYKTYVKHQLKHAKAKMRVYGRKAITRLGLDHYIKRQGLLNKVVNFFTEDKGKIAVFYGNSKIASSSIIKGHIRLPQQALINAFLNNEKCVMYGVDEFRSTKLCSKCFGELETKKGRKRYRRMICKSCKTVWHRDVNAGRNMIMLGLCDHFGHTKPEEFKRELRVSSLSRYSFIANCLC